MPHLLTLEDLQISFKNGKEQVHVVDHMNLSVDAGEIFCIVGESGCGKTVTALSIMDLLSGNGSVTHGKIYFDGQDLGALSRAQRARLRGSEMSMVFQDALRALNPVFTIGNQLMEAIFLHSTRDRKAAYAHAVSMLEKVGIPDPVAVMKKYPHTLSGGQRQRVLIAMALACRPKLLIADEPTTALDVTIQAQIVRLLKDLREETGMSILLITHDIGLVAEVADRVAVMYAGQIVESGDVWRIFESPSHPYTQALLRSVPSVFGGEAKLASIAGSVPEGYMNIPHCRFADRCPYADESCQKQQLSDIGAGHLVRCHKAGQTAQVEGEVALHACN